jgi:HupE / UreJ protein
VRSRQRVTPPSAIPAWAFPPTVLIVAVALVAFLFLKPSQRAHAHPENSTAFSSVEFSNGSVDYLLKLDYFELGRVVAFGAQPGDPQAVLRAALAANASGLSAYLDEKLKLFTGGVRCESELTTTEVERLLDKDYAAIQLPYHCPSGDIGDLLIRYDIFFDDNDPSHSNIVDYRLPGGSGQALITADEREFRAGESSLTGQVRGFARMGFEHILAGYDHVLFVIVLLLGTASLGGVLKVATAFTAAHSVTLILTAVGWVRVPAEVVEPLIALSIAYVALDNLLGASGRTNLPVVFGFGLLHGMGFAGTLQVASDVDLSMLLSLLTFNLGIELGQAVIILALFPVLTLARRYEWTRMTQVPATCLVGVVGCVWFFERLLA